MRLRHFVGQPVVMGHQAGDQLPRLRQDGGLLQAGAFDQLAQRHHGIEQSLGHDPLLSVPSFEHIAHAASSCPENIKI
ncbi:Uncharacterised protein [Bordetella pertussis]|nr:Uncharacterised protein [Bordetella pertussis]